MFFALAFFVLGRKILCESNETNHNKDDHYMPNGKFSRKKSKKQRYISYSFLIVIFNSSKNFIKFHYYRHLFDHNGHC